MDYQQCIRVYLNWHSRRNTCCLNTYFKAGIEEEEVRGRRSELWTLESVCFYLQWEKLNSNQSKHEGDRLYLLAKVQGSQIWGIVGYRDLKEESFHFLVLPSELVLLLVRLRLSCSKDGSWTLQVDRSLLPWPPWLSECFDVIEGWVCTQTRLLISLYKIKNWLR